MQVHTRGPGNVGHLVKRLLEQVALVPLVDDKDAAVVGDFFVQRHQLFLSCVVGQSSPFQGLEIVVKGPPGPPLQRQGTQQAGRQLRQQLDILVVDGRHAEAILRQ